MANNSFRNRIIDDPKIRLHASDPLPKQQGQEHDPWVALPPTQPPCLHMRCPNCGGTGSKRNGFGPCIHMISCPCPSCTPMM